MEVIDTIYNPPTDSNYGGKNLKDADYLPGFPYGTILKPSDTLLLNNLAGKPITVDKFELFQVEGQPLPSKVTNQLISIPGKALKFEQEYHWRLVSQGKTYNGSFDIAYEEDQQDLQQEIANRLKQQPMGEAGKLVVKAAVSKSYGYTFDYQQAVNDARQKLVK